MDGTAGQDLVKLSLLCRISLTIRPLHMNMISATWKSRITDTIKSECKWVLVTVLWPGKECISAWHCRTIVKTAHTSNTAVHDGECKACAWRAWRAWPVSRSMAAPAELESRTAGCVRSGVYIGNPIHLSGLKYPLSQPAGLFRCIDGVGRKELRQTPTLFFS